MRKHQRTTIAAPDWLLSLAGTPSDRVTIPTLAAALGVHEVTVRNWTKSGRLRTITVGGRSYVPRDAAEELLKGERASA